MSKKQVDRPSRDRLFLLDQFQESFYSKETSSKAIRMLGSTERIPHSSLKQIDELTSIRLKEMRVNQVHYGRYLICKTITQPDYYVKVVVEDEDNECEMLGLYNFLTSHEINPTSVLPLGSVLIIKEPYMTFMAQQAQKKSKPYIRVDSPSDIVIVTGTHNIEKWIPGISFEKLQSQAHTYFKNKEYQQAIDCYKRADTMNNEFTKELNANLALCYLKLENYYLAYEHASKAPTEKGYFRQAQAAYAMRQYVKSIEFYEKCLKINPKNVQALKEIEKAKDREDDELNCGFDLNGIAMYYRTNTKRHDRGDYQLPCIKIIDIPNKGKGLITTKSIKKGELIVSSKAISIVYNDECNFNDMNINRLLGETEMGVVVANKLSLLHKVKNDPFYSKRVYDLYGGPHIERSQPVADGIVDLDRLSSILTYNSFTSENFPSSGSQRVSQCGDPLGNVKENSGIWLIPSYFNHSCVPNCRRIFTGDYCIIFALRDIKENEELTYSYLVDHDFEERSQALCHRWSFKCTCDWCEFERNDEGYKRKKIQFKKELNSKTFKSKSPQQIENSIERINEIYFGRTQYKLYMVAPLTTLAQAYNSTKNYQKSIEIYLKIADMVELLDDNAYLNALKEAISIYLKINDEKSAEKLYKRIVKYFSFHTFYCYNILLYFGFPQMEKFLDAFQLNDGTNSMSQMAMFNQLGNKFMHLVI